MFFFHLVQFTSFKFGSTSFRKLTSIGLRLDEQKNKKPLHIVTKDMLKIMISYIYDNMP